MVGSTWGLISGVADALVMLIYSSGIDHTQVTISISFKHLRGLHIKHMWRIVSFVSVFYHLSAMFFLSLKITCYKSNCEG